MQPPIILNIDSYFSFRMREKKVKEVLGHWLNWCETMFARNEWTQINNSTCVTRCTIDTESIQSNQDEFYHLLQPHHSSRHKQWFLVWMPFCWTHLLFEYEIWSMYQMWKWFASILPVYMAGFDWPFVFIFTTFKRIYYFGHIYFSMQNISKWSNFYDFKCNCYCCNCKSSARIPFGQCIYGLNRENFMTQIQRK